jgi:uncharacterized membrane protein YkvA (DUF1232 family)
VKRDVLVVYLVARDSRVPWPVKVLAAAVAAYALSPIDLIPDFIPLVGYLDDLVIVPLGILAVVKLVPTEILAELARTPRGGWRPDPAAGPEQLSSFFSGSSSSRCWSVGSYRSFSLLPDP